MLSPASSSTLLLCFHSVDNIRKCKSHKHNLESVMVMKWEDVEIGEPEDVKNSNEKESHQSKTSLMFISVKTSAKQLQYGDGGSGNNGGPGLTGQRESESRRYCRIFRFPHGSIL
ncbi:unnamed protein product [Lactuca saligna]|uniref:Uncharacterized protein n=1 Tax=Lactuca saligna TaxID=75948 RepID=A0AA35Z2Y6_LACSI|nr:unnamed protein product [Lactuca saligna]